MAHDQQLVAFVAEHLTESQIDTLAREGELGPLSFVDTKPPLRTIRDILTAAAQVERSELPQTARSAIEQQINRLPGVLQQMRNFGVADSNPKATRDSLAGQVVEVRDVLLREVRPVLSVDQAELLSLKQQLEYALQQSREATSASETAAADVRGSVLEASAEKLSHFYGEQATAHEKSAKAFRRGVFCAGGVAGVAIVGLFWVAPPRIAAGDATNVDTALFIRESLLRLLLVGLAFVALNFCLRNYRVNKHLQTVNEARANALETVGPLTRGAIASDAGREVVIHELVSAVFAVGDTGYVSGSGDRTVVESSNSLASILAALRPSS